MKGKEKVKETVYVRNCETRDKYIQQKGIESFLKLGEKDEKWKRLREPEVPIKFLWIWKHFLQIWQGCEYDMCGNVIFTFSTINDYVECMKVPLTIQDKKELLKMKAWAVNQISEMKEEV